MTHPAFPFSCPDCANVFTSNASLLAHLKKAHKANEGQAGNKFHAEKVVLDGYTFGSGAEARRYQELLLLQRAGEINGLEVHPTYKFYVNTIYVGRYTPDFVYREKGWLTGQGQFEDVVEDVKGGKATKTEAYGLRKRLMWAIHGIRIREV